MILHVAGLVPETLFPEEVDIRAETICVTALANAIAAPLNAVNSVGEHSL